MRTPPEGGTVVSLVAASGGMRSAYNCPMTEPPAAEQKSVTLTPQTARCDLTGQGVAAIANSSSRVDMKDFVGRASSWIEDDGRIGVLIRDAPLRGEDNEPSVLEVLRHVLAVEEPGASIEPGENTRGEDALLRLADGSMLTVQVTTVPPHELVNQEIAQGVMERHLTCREAAGWVQASIQLKLPKIPPSMRPKTVLVLDARHLAIFASQPVLTEFRAAFPQVSTYGFAQIRLIGPLAARSERLA